VLGGLALLERLVGAGQHALQLAEDAVDPFELVQDTGLAQTDEIYGMRTFSIGYSGKASKAVAEDAGTRGDVGARPLGNGLAAKAWYRRHLGVDKVSQVVERHRRNKRDLVLRAAPGFATAALAIRLGIVNLYSAGQPVLRVALSHGTHDLVVHQPRCRLTHSDLEYEVQRRQACFRLIEHIDGKAPLARWQFGTRKQRAWGQRSLVMATVALVQPLCTARQYPMRTASNSAGSGTPRPKGTEGLDAGGLRCGESKKPPEATCLAEVEWGLLDTTSTP
jgi:hypothetical protein